MKTSDKMRVLINTPESVMPRSLRVRIRAWIAEVEALEDTIFELYHIIPVEWKGSISDEAMAIVREVIDE